MKKIGRNDPCWCGSGKKYKQCHMAFDNTKKQYKIAGEEVPTRNMIKNEAEIAAIRESAKINTAVLDEVAKHIKEGMTTQDIDDIVYNFTKAQGAIPAPLGYEGFPKSVCTSVNNQICHGIPSKDVVLKSGDIINVDVSTIYKGYYSDASRMFCIGEVSEEAKRLVDVTKECLELGLATIKPWSHLGDIGAAIQKHAHENGYSVVVEFVGHGVGIEFHEEPMVPHYGVAGNGVLLAPGMIFTVEPMINQGRSELYVDEENGWTSYTKDGKLSAQWEHMVLVTEDGIEILSK